MFNVCGEHGDAGYAERAGGVNNDPKTKDQGRAKT
jgi:hypothetical protein